MSYNILTGDPTRPTPTGLASAPLPPRRKLRDGRDSSSVSSGSSVAGGVSSGRSGSSARGKGLGRGRGGRDSDASRASSRASSGLGELYESSSTSGSEGYWNQRYMDPSHAQASVRWPNPVETYRAAKSTMSFAQTDSPLMCTGESRASRELSTAPSTRPATPRMNGFGPVAPIAPPLPAASSASAANSTNNNRPAGGNMDFMRELGWEVHDDPNIQTAFEMDMAYGPNGRYANGLEGRQDGDRGWISGAGAVTAPDQAYAEDGGQGRDAPFTSQGNAEMVEDLIDPDLAEFSTHPDEFADAAEPDPWDANHPNHPYPQHHRAARASSTRGAGSGGGRINAFVSGRSPSPTAGADAGSRSPSPALPLPLAISARNMMAGHGQAVQADSDFAFDFAGGADGAEGQDGVQVLPEWDDEYEAQLANNNHAAHPAPMQTDEGRGARAGGSALLDRLDAWNDANDASLAASDIASERTRSRARPTPATLPTHAEAINGDSIDGTGSTDGNAMRNPSADSIVMLDGPPASAPRPNGTGHRGVGTGDAPIAISGSSGSSGSGSGSGGSAGGSGNSSPAEGSDEAGVGTGRRYTREEKGKGRAVPITRTTRGARADIPRNTDVAGTTGGSHLPEPRSKRRLPALAGERAPGHAAAAPAMSESDDADADVEYTGRSRARRQTKKRIRGSDEEDELAGDTDTELFGSGNTADDGNVDMEGGLDVGNDSVQWIDPPSPVAAKSNDKGRRSKRAKVEGEVAVKVEVELGGEEEASYEREEERPEDKLQGLDTQTCPVCFDALSKPVMTLCGHVHCYGCLTSTLIHSIKANPNPHPGQRAPITAAGRGRNGQHMVAHRTANQRAAGRGGRGGGRANGRGNKAAAALLDPTILPAGSAELQPAQWTAPLLAAALREHKLQRELEQYIQAGMDANDAQAALDAVHADDAPIPDETAANRGEVVGVRERLKGLWEVDAHAMPPRGEPGGSGVGNGGGTGRAGGNLRVMDKYWVIEGECPICRVPLPGGLGPWDSGIGGVIPLGAVLVDRSKKGQRRAKVEP